MRYTWLCRSCDKVSSSASPHRDKKMVRCSYPDCRVLNVNPYYTGEGEEVENVEALSNDSTDELSKG